MNARNRVACLHSSAGNIPIFDRAVQDLDLTLHHIVRADLLAAAEQAGEVDADIARATEDALRAAAADADIVLLTCSTLGPVADTFSGWVPTLRIDRALAEAAVKHGKRIAVLYTAPTTARTTEGLFRTVAVGSDAVIEMRFVGGAWDALKAGDKTRYGAMIAEAADLASAGGATSIIFAQASMAPAADLCHHAKPLTSPHAGLLAAASKLRRRSDA